MHETTEEAATAPRTDPALTGQVLTGRTRQALTTQGLTKAFGRTPVLTGVDLTLPAGQVLALLGPNGAGKTTVVRILSTLLRPDTGSATVAGHDVLEQPALVRRAISLTGQYAAVDQAQTGRENLRMMGLLSPLPRRAVAERVDALLTAFDLTAAADRRVETYSGGMRRRLDLAAGLLVPPPVLFLDEPTTGLDPRSRQTMWEVIEQIVAEGSSLLLTTQYLEEADALADTVAMIDGGRIVAEGSPAELKRAVGEAALVLHYGAADQASAAAEQLTAAGLASACAAGEVRVPTDGTAAHAARVLGLVASRSVPPSDWSLRRPTLDDAFLALTGSGTSTPDPRPTTQAREVA